MSDDLPRLALWGEDGAGGYKWLDDLAYTELTAERRFLAEGTWSISGPFNSRVMQNCLVTIDYRGRRFLTGTVEPAPSRTVEEGALEEDVNGEGALSRFRAVTIWPDPGSAIGNQPGVATDGYYRIAAAPAEDVVRQLVSDHYGSRYGAAITVPNSLHRGGTVRVHDHMSDLLQIAVAKARRGGIGFEVGLVDSTGTRAALTLSFFVPATLSPWARLADGDGTLRSWSQSSPPPTCNRAIVWGLGDEYVVVEDTASIAQWGRAYEQFIEAQDTFDLSDLQERGEEAIDQGAASSTYQLDAAESVGMRWGEHYDVGDQVLIELAAGITFTDVVSAVTLKAATDSGVSVSPTIGNPDGDKAAMTQAKLISQLAASARKQETRRP